MKADHSSCNNVPWEDRILHRDDIVSHDSKVAVCRQLGLKRHPVLVD